MIQVVFRQEALEDLESIAKFISAQDPNAADRVIQRIHRSIYKTIAAFPEGGRLNRGTGAREFAVPRLPYLIVYVPQPDCIDVVAIFHTSRDPETKRTP